MKHAVRTAFALAALVLASPALAWGITLSTPLTDGLAEALGVDELGDALYELQEGVHEVVTETTGIEIPHDYVDVCLGEACLHVDPIRFSN